jgi:hypothetical protein
MRGPIKKISQTVKRARLQKGKTVAPFCKKQMIMNWKDTRDVELISTFNDDSMVDVKTRKWPMERGKSYHIGVLTVGRPYVWYHVFKSVTQIEI